MFNAEFYPTPPHLVEKMLNGIDFKAVKSALEPSAGKGDIAKIVAEKMNHAANRWGRNEDFSKCDIDTVEISPDLRHILKGHGLRVVHDDFLTCHTFKRYDLIIMNPPFSNGDKHLLKALEMQERGGQIVCLLNAETLKNPCTNSRRDLMQKLTDLKAQVEFIPDAFIGAERRTGVEIALIKVNIANVQPVSSIFENLRQEEQQCKSATEPQAYSIIDSDFIRGIVQQYNFEIKVGLKLIEEYRAIKPYISNSLENDPYSKKPILKLDFCDCERYSDSLNENEFVRRVRAKYWKALFSNNDFMSLLTTNLREEYYNRVATLCDYDFSLYNIYTLRCEMSQNMVVGVEDTILNLFDELSHKHYWDEETSKNIHYYNGWKTNSAYKVNKKVIIPLNGFRDLSYSWGGQDVDDYKVVQKLGDIEKVFNYLDGGLTEEVDITRALKKAQAHGITKRIPLKYFDVTFFKKGTCHIEFSNLELVKKFNIFGSQKKNWIPPAYGKKAYSDMTAEEKSVIDEFEGKAEYEKTMQNRSYYLFAASDILMIDQPKQNKESA